MHSFLATLAAFMNDEWYLECRAPEPAAAKDDQFVAMLACFMNDEEYLKYHP